MPLRVAVKRQSSVFVKALVLNSASSMMCSADDSHATAPLSQLESHICKLFVSANWTFATDSQLKRVRSAVKSEQAKSSNLLLPSKQQRSWLVLKAVSIEPIVSLKARLCLLVYCASLGLGGGFNTRHPNTCSQWPRRFTFLVLYVTRLSIRASRKKQTN